MARTDAPRGTARVNAPGAPSASGGPLREADAALADRFRRVLGAPRRDADVATGHDAAPSPAEPPLCADAVGLADAADLPGLRGSALRPVPGLLDDERAPPRRDAASEPPDAGEPAPEAGEVPPPSFQPQAAARPAGQPGAAPAAWAWQGGHGGGGPQRGPQGEAAPVVDAEPEPAWLRDTAGFVGSLCAGVDAGFQTWRMSVPLDARQLPDTQLELSLSPHTLCLRFRAGAPGSARLVLRHRQSLLDLLGQVPGLPSHIEIELD